MLPKEAVVKRLVPMALVLALTVLGTAACGDVPQGAIATVGGVPVSKAQFEQYIDQARASADQGGQSAFPSPGTPAYRRYAAEAVNSAVQQQVILNVASALKITVTGQQVQAQLEQTAAQYGGLQKLYAAARKGGLNTDLLSTYMKDSLLSQMVYQKVTGKAPPTEQQMQAYYHANKTQFVQPATRTVRHILVKTRAEALRVRALLLANDTNADWAKVAREFSIDPGSKDAGGSLGAITRTEMVKPFADAAFALPLDTISMPVHSRYGWHVIEVTAIAEAKTTTFAAAKANIRNALLTQKWQYWLTWTQKAAKIHYAAGYDPVQLTASPSPSPQGHESLRPSPSPSSST